MHKICIITSGYPTKQDPSYAFIRPLVMEFADNGCECFVIAPQSLTASLVKRKQTHPIIWQDQTERGNLVSVFQPLYLSFSNLKFCGFCISDIFRKRAIKKILQTQQIHPDFFYAHFWDNGIIAASLCGGKNVFVATGESKIWVKDKYPVSYIDFALKKIKGVIAVSSKNLKESVELSLLKKNKASVVLPNAYNPKEFYKKNKEECQKKLGYCKDDFIVSFVGSFSKRKGVDRLIEAAQKLPHIRLQLIGSGNIDINSQQIIYKGPLSHNRIADYLNASDVFVLPTLAEGCCNAIIEAMACGLPIISSNLPFNDDILDDECSIRINPESIDEIADAINLLYCNEDLRTKMGAAALKKAANMTIEKRAKAILEFMEENAGHL